MGIENPVHLLFIAVIALIVLGPRRLPELTRALGRSVREFREAISQQGSPPEDALVSETHTGEEPAPHQVAAADEPATTVGEPATVPRPASGGAPADLAAVDPARPVRSGDAPDRRPL